MAKASTKSILADIKGLKGGKAPAPAKSQTPKPSKIGNKPEKKVDRRKFNQRHPDSGRKAGGTAMQRRLNKTLLSDHFGEEVDVKVKDPKTGEEHIIKKPRLIVQIERLFQAGMQNGVIDSAAVDRWLNRAVGKAPQPLIGDEEEDPIQVDLGVDRLLGSAYGEAEDEEKE